MVDGQVGRQAKQSLKTQGENFYAVPTAFDINSVWFYFTGINWYYATCRFLAYLKLKNDQSRRCGRFCLNQNFGFKQVLSNDIAPGAYMQQYKYNKKVLMYILTNCLCYGNMKTYTYHV